MQKIYPCIWFDTQAEEAAKLYTSIFKNSKIEEISYYGDEGQEITGKKPGEVMTVVFTIEGQKFMALNGGPHFKLNEAVSLVVDCDTQEEIDAYWNKLSAHPEAEQCGWLKDKFGLSWQITPRILEDMLKDKDRAKANRAMRAMLQMHKLDIKKLQDAFDGK